VQSQNSELVLERIRHLPIGGRMKDIPPHLWHDSFIRVGEKNTGGPNLRLLRLDPDLPSNTITAYIFNKFAHPFEDRYITPREAARIQQFPDTHIFVGPITSVQLQIGNAVPIGLADAVASHISSYLHKISKKQKFSAISLFSGAGGMDLGFERYFKVLAANEYDEDSCETLRLNFPDLNVIQGDISAISINQLTTQAVDLLYGGPPCQPFSAAGKQRGTKDPRGKMLDEYMRILAGLKPKVFVLENVKGLVYNQKGGALKYILQAAQKLGYEVEWKVLTATDYGVPQRRQRLFVIGRREGYPPVGFPDARYFDQESGQQSLFLEPCPTVKDAFANLPSVNQVRI
jgi:DNA (cytosine-5)-methyltransferase 1